MRALLIIVSLAGLTACAQNDPVQTSFWREAGSVVDQGTFGNATMNNTQLQSGERSFVVALGERFSSEVNPTINFTFDSSALDEESRAVLREQANWIRQFPEIRFRVYGHTDLVGSNAYNKRLGLQRARAAVNYLVSQGIDRSRLEAVVSFGETQPLIVTQGRERRNRRTVTEVTGFDRSQAALLDGKYAQIIYRDYVESAVAPTGLTGIESSDLEAGE